MKKIIFTALLSILPLTTEAAKWIKVTPVLSYDESSIVTSKIENDFLLIETWARVYDPAANEGEYGRLGNVKIKYLIRCGSKKEIMASRFVAHKANGELVDDISIPAHIRTWIDVVPDTGVEKLATTMCRIAYNKHMRPQKQQTPKRQTPNSSDAQGHLDL